MKKLCPILRPAITRFVAPFLGLVVSVATKARAELNWQESEIAIQAPIDAEIVPADFHFRNVGRKTVKIAGLSVSCGCVTASAAVQEIAPGESGAIHAVFHAKGREGHQEKFITVAMEGTDQRETTLKLTVDLPQPISIQPHSLHWRVGESADAKEFDVLINDTEVAEIYSATSTSADFSAALIRDGQNRYRISVVPNGTRKPAQEAIQVKAAVKGRERVLTLYAAVR